MITKAKNIFKQNLSAYAANCLVSVGGWKSTLRTSLTKKYSEAVSTVEKVIGKPEYKLRLLRAYKVDLFNHYCNCVLQQVYKSSIKYDLLSQF